MIQEQGSFAGRCTATTLTSSIRFPKIGAGENRDRENRDRATHSLICNSLNLIRRTSDGGFDSPDICKRSVNAVFEGPTSE